MRNNLPATLESPAPSARSLGGERTHLGLVSQRIADPDLGGPPDQVVEERVGDAFLQVEPRAGDAALAAGAEDAGHHAVDGALQVRVLEHHDRRLAAELEGDLGEVLRRVAHDVARRLRPAGEADPGDQGVRGERQLMLVQYLIMLQLHLMVHLASMLLVIMHMSQQLLIMV